MTRADLDKRAALTVWPGHGQAHVAQGHEFPTLRLWLSWQPLEP